MITVYYIIVVTNIPNTVNIYRMNIDNLRRFHDLKSPYTIMSIIAFESIKFQTLSIFGFLDYFSWPLQIRHRFRISYIRRRSITTNVIQYYVTYLVQKKNGKRHLSDNYL